MVINSLDRAARMASAAMLGLIVACGGAGLWSTWQQSAALESQRVAGELLRNHMNADMMHDAVRADVLAALQARDPRSGVRIDAVQKDLAEHVATLKSAIATDRAYQKSAEVSAATANLVDAVNSYAAAAQQISALAATDPGRADAELSNFFREFHALEGSMEKAADAISSHSDAMTDSATMLGRIAMIVLLAALLAGIGGSVLLALRVRSYLVRPLLELAATVQKLAAGDRSSAIGIRNREDELGALASAIESFRSQLNAADAALEAQARLIVDSIGKGLSALADGDLTAAVQADLSPPYDSLKTNFNEALSSLRDLIASVMESASSIQTGSGEIAQASENLARRTETNAASLEETSAAISQIDQRLKATAEAATQTVARADGAMNTVSGGRALADDAVSAMGRVAESAKGIDSVIEGLDKIAFQTRVLAMNAAVEAGRAGEAGRGFAVVADLVGALAMRSEEEAKAAREQLTSTQADVIGAVEAVQKVDGALAAISADVGSVHELLDRMATDNQAQSSAISQIATAIDSMDKATQQNAAMVEETSAAARTLSNEVNVLTQQAARFNVGNGPARAKTAARIEALKTGGSPYRSPVKPLPTEAVSALTRSNEDWNAF